MVECLSTKVDLSLTYFYTAIPLICGFSYYSQLQSKNTKQRITEVNSS
jgi:hypothetical protein